MAHFGTAYNILKQAEFSNNIDNALHDVSGDSGGLTYKGITRKYFKNSKVWKIIDEYLNKYPDLSYRDISLILETDAELQEEVRQFYREEFWDKLWGDAIRNQIVANLIFLFAVNAGIKPAVHMVQKIVGAKEDGIMGQQTIMKVNTTYKLDEMLKQAQTRYYKSLNQPKFIVGWLNRIALAGRVYEHA